MGLKVATIKFALNWHSSTLCDVRKVDALPSESRARAAELVASYEGHILTFTDGSKSSEGVGCAFVTGCDTRTFTLPANSSVFTSELVAIGKALCFIEARNEALHLILTDSLSSLLALRSFYPSHPLVQDILSRLTALNQAGKSIQLCWIPSHVGIPGNELADAAARRAASAPCTRRLPLPARDFYPAVSAFVLCQWQEAWQAQPRNKLRNIKPALEPWFSSSRRSRREEVILCRLRIGHTYATHGYILRGAERPLCPRCREPLSVSHIMLTCPQHRRSRMRHLGHIAPDTTLRAVLGEGSDWVRTGQLFSFIRAIKLSNIYHILTLVTQCHHII